MAGKEEGLGFDFGADFSGEVVGGFLGLAENDDLAVFELRRRFEDGPEGFPFGVAGDLLPLVADGFQRLQIVFEVGNERGQEVFGGQLFGLVFLDEAVNALLVIGAEQFKDLRDVFLADEDVALLELSDHALVGVDEAPEGGEKRGEAAFEALHREDFHELGEVALALDVLLVALAGVVGQRGVAGVFEVVREGADRLVENLRLDFVELVEERFGVGDFRELEALAFQVFAVVTLDFGARAPDHEELENLLAGLAGIFANDLEVLVAVALAVEPLEPAAERAEEGFEVADVGDGAVFGGLEQLVWLRMSCGVLLSGVAETRTTRLPRQICASIS